MSNVARWPGKSNDCKHVKSNVKSHYLVQDLSSSLSPLISTWCFCSFKDCHWQCLCCHLIISVWYLNLQFLFYCKQISISIWNLSCWQKSLQNIYLLLCCSALLQINPLWGHKRQWFVADHFHFIRKSQRGSCIYLWNQKVKNNNTNEAFVAFICKMLTTCHFRSLEHHWSSTLFFFFFCSFF